MFGFEHGLFSKSININELKIGIEAGLKRVEFVEEFLNKTYVIKYRKKLNNLKIKSLIAELEKIRLDMEFEHNGR